MKQKQKNARNVIRNGGKCFIVAAALFMLCITSKKAFAQDTVTIDGSEQIQDIDSIPDFYDKLETFFFYVTETYYISHWMYCDDLETMINYSYDKFATPNICYYWFLENRNKIRIESSPNEISFFINDTFFTSDKQPFDPQYYETNIRLRSFIRLFDGNGLLIGDSGNNIYKYYSKQKRKMLLKMHKVYGYDVEMQKLYDYDGDVREVLKNERPVTVLFIYDSEGLRLHPQFAGYEEKIDNEYKQHITQLATSLCSKFKAKKAIFPSQIIHKR